MYGSSKKGMIIIEIGKIIYIARQEKNTHCFAYVSIYNNSKFLSHSISIFFSSRLRSFLCFFFCSRKYLFCCFQIEQYYIEQVDKKTIFIVNKFYYFLFVLLSHQCGIRNIIQLDICIVYQYGNGITFTFHHHSIFYLGISYIFFLANIKPSEYFSFFCAFFFRSLLLLDIYFIKQKKNYVRKKEAQMSTMFYVYMSDV